MSTLKKISILPMKEYLSKFKALQPSLAAVGYVMGDERVIEYVLNQRETPVNCNKPFDLLIMEEILIKQLNNPTQDEGDFQVKYSRYNTNFKYNPSKIVYKGYNGNKQQNGSGQGKSGNLIFFLMFKLTLFLLFYLRIIYLHF